VPHEPHGAAAVRFLTADPGRVVSVTGAGRAAAIDGVLEVEVSVRPGDVVRPTRWSEDRCGHVLVRAHDSAAAAKLARRAAELIRIRTEPSGDAVPSTLPEILASVDESLWPPSVTADRGRVVPSRPAGGAC
jgi:hypothetical protein